MIVLCLLPAVLSLLLLAAHFLRAGNMVLVFCALATTGLLLSLRRCWTVYHMFGVGTCGACGSPPLPGNLSFG